MVSSFRWDLRFYFSPFISLQIIKHLHILSWPKRSIRAPYEKLKRNFWPTRYLQALTFSVTQFPALWEISQTHLRPFPGAPYSPVLPQQGLELCLLFPRWAPGCLCGRYFISDPGTWHRGLSLEMPSVHLLNQV